jgi:hypothetical protein
VRNWYESLRLSDAQATGDTPDAMAARVDREFGELQASPFLRIWASAAGDEILSASTSGSF